MKLFVFNFTLALAGMSVFSSQAVAQPPVTHEIQITASSNGSLRYQDPNGNNATKQKAKKNEKVEWICNTVPAGETVVSFEIAFPKTPFCKNGCAEEDHGNGNNHGPRISKSVKGTPVIGLYKYAVAVVTREANGNIRLYLDDPEIDIQP